MSRIETILVDGQPMRACVAGPEQPRAGVVVMIHGPGIDRFIEDRVDALAQHGLLAVAPDVFHRQPDDGTEAMTRVGRLRDREILEDVDAAVAYLRARVERIAVLGFCMGGRNTYLAAGARPAIWKCACVFYGGNIMVAWGEPDGPAPFALTERIECPLIGLFGAEDTNPSPEDVDRIAAELARHGKPHEFHIYPGAGHAFLNFTNPARYREAQAGEAWPKALAFLDRYL